MFNYNFFASTKQLKKLWLLEELKQNPQLTQQSLADKIGITRGMVNRYLTEFKADDLMTADNELTRQGANALYELQKQYQQELDIVYNFIKSEKNKYQQLTESKVRVAAIKSLGTMLPYLADRAGILADYPFELKVDYYQSGQELMKNFQVGNYHWGLLGIVPAFLWQASGSEITLEAMVNKGGHAIIGQQSIHSVADLAGKTVLVPVVNDSVSDNLLKKLVSREQIKVKRIDFSDLGLNWEQLLDGEFNLQQLDAILLWEPYISFLLQSINDFHLIYDFQQYQGNYSSNVLIINQNRFDEQQQGLAEQMFGEVIAWLNENKQQAVCYLQEFFQMDAAVIKSALERVEFDYTTELEGDKL